MRHGYREEASRSIGGEHQGAKGPPLFPSPPLTPSQEGAQGQARLGLT
jgi:hypothetical protein